MNIVRRIVNRVHRMWYGPSGYLRETWDREERIAYLERVVEYLTWQTTNQGALLRYLAAPHIHELPIVSQTKESFDFQWAEIPTGRYMLDNPQFRAEAPGYVCDFTSLPRAWFQGKTVFDVGCGMGRYSWALCELGADVLSLDQSDHGLRLTAEACRDFPRHRVMKADLLKPLPLDEHADLVWSFGVLHHTGDTYGAFRNVAPLVKRGGYMYMMIYGEPRPLFGLDYEEINEYEYWRHRTLNVGLRDKVAAIRKAMAAGEFRVVGDEHVHGYFDAISPRINDLYTFEELESWLLDAGFVDIRRTIETRNHHIIARRAD
jgi:SAM-dependent methyltransferase